MYVLGIDDASNARECGFKAASLAGLKAIVPVPSGFAIMPQAFEAFLSVNSLKEKVKSVYESNSQPASGTAPDVEKCVRDLFINASIPKDVGSAVMKSYGGFSISDDVRSAGNALGLIKAGRGSQMVAVRPSVIRNEGDTFAGVLDSFINVSGEEDLLRCVKLCWASLFYPRASGYMERKGISVPSMSVIVQRMAPSEKGGSVLTGFGSDNVLVEASWGPGSAVSSGVVTPDEYLLRGDGRLLEKNISKKLWMFERNDYTGVTSKVYVPASMMDSQVLTEQELRKLYELSMRIAGDGKNQYVIDWAIGRNRVMIMDAKPVKFDIGMPCEEPAGGEVVVTGRFVSGGIAQGKVRKMDASASPPGDGSVLVTESSDAGMLIAATGIAGVVTEEGGRLSNMGVLAREFSIPALSATHNAKSILSEGQDVRILAGAGKVVVMPSMETAKDALAGNATLLQGAGGIGGCTGMVPGIAGGAAALEIEKVLLGVSAGAGIPGNPVMVFAKSAPETAWSAPGAEGFIIYNAAEANRQEVRGAPGVPLWISCAGESDFPSAAALARKLADSGAKATGILVPVVKGREDIEKFRYGMPSGTMLGASLKTPAMLLSPDLACDGMSMVNIELEPLLQLSMGLQKPGNHIHDSVLEMVGRVCGFCSQKGILCCVTLGGNHLTDWNLESLAGRGIGAVCVDHPCVQETKGLLMRIAKNEARTPAPQDGGPAAGEEVQEKASDGFMPFDLGSSFS
ncbi:MAG: PEP/pyruvate-binding domain-containing protein [Candidatus Aenigmatarchaeota archaeon]